MDRTEALGQALDTVQNADLTPLKAESDIMTNPDAESVWHVEN